MRRRRRMWAGILATTRITTASWKSALLGLLLGFGASSALACELRVLGPRVIWTVLGEIGPSFERSAGCRLEVVSDIAVTLAEHIEAGERFDVYAGPPALVDRLVAAGKLAPDSVVPLMRSGIGVAVRAGAPKPDIATVASFRRALLDARSVGFLKRGTSGLYLEGLMERLGLAEELRGKLVRPETDIVSRLLAAGEIDLGMVVISQILTSPGVELV